MSEHSYRALFQQLKDLDQELLAKAKVSKRVRLNKQHLQQTFGHFQGCTELEITMLLQIQGVDFIPELYKQFLLEMGHRSGGLLFKGRLGNYEYIRSFKSQAIIVVADMPEALELPTDAFVFMTDQASFSFFLTEDKNQNPSIYEFHEYAPWFFKVNDRLTDWFEDQISEIRKAIEQEF